jgi:hypothetical protein
MGAKRVCSATSLIVLVVVLTLAGAVPAAAASPNELLQQAIYTEETVGNLDEAMKLYESQVAAGNNYGLIDLSNLYQWGRGTAKDEAKAEALLRQAILDPDPDISVSAKNQLAWLFAVTNRNLAEAEALAEAAIAFDDVSLPLPKMRRPDVRQRVIEAVLDLAA